MEQSKFIDVALVSSGAYYIGTITAFIASGWSFFAAPDEAASANAIQVGTGAIVLGVCGLLGRLAQLFFQDRRERRQSREHVLEAKIKEQDAKIQLGLIHRESIEQRITAGNLRGEWLRLQLEERGIPTDPPPDPHSPEGQAVLSSSGFHDPPDSSSGSGADAGVVHAPRLLIVEDDSDTVAILRLLFRNSGWRVHVARNVAQALSSLRRVTPDVLVLDLNIPGGGGEIVLRHIHEADLDLGIVVLTGVVDEDRLVMVREAGVDSVLSKPYEFGSLRDAVTLARRDPAIGGDQ